jgi:hypothetical protein
MLSVILVGFAVVVAPVTIECKVTKTASEDIWTWRPSLSIQTTTAPPEEVVQRFTIDYQRGEIFVVDGPTMLDGDVITLSEVTAQTVSLRAHHTALHMPTIGRTDSWELSLNRETGHLRLWNNSKLEDRSQTLSSSNESYAGYCSPVALVPFPQTRF